MKFTEYPSILKNNEVVNKQKFSFKATTQTEMGIGNFYSKYKKAIPSNNVFSKELKENVDVCGRILH